MKLLRNVRSQFYQRLDRDIFAIIMPVPFIGCGLFCCFLWLLLLHHIINTLKSNAKKDFRIEMLKGKKIVYIFKDKRIVWVNKSQPLGDFSPISSTFRLMIVFCKIDIVGLELGWENWIMLSALIINIINEFWIVNAYQSSQTIFYQIIKCHYSRIENLCYLDGVSNSEVAICSRTN